MSNFNPQKSGASQNWTRGLLALAVASSLGLAAFVGCNTDSKPRAGPLPIDIQDQINRNLNPALLGTIGQYAALADAAPVQLEGYGIVANLPGTGSGVVDPTLRQQLIDKLMLNDGAGSYANGTQDIDPEAILRSDKISVVEVHGIMPPLARKGSTFDLTINAMAGSQTTSLANGLLWTTDLKVIATPGIESATVAMGRGPVYIPGPVEAIAGTDQSNSTVKSRALRSGRVLGGGVSIIDRPIQLQLYTPSAAITRAIEMTINARFPDSRNKIADAVDSSRIELKIPLEYSLNPAGFVDLVRRLYLSTAVPGFTEQCAAQLIETLKQPGTPHRDLSLALQGLGRSILPDYIEPQYTSPDPEVRFWCARAGACMQDSKGMMILQETIQQRGNPHHEQAVDALVEASLGRDIYLAGRSLMELMKSPNTDDRIMAYRGLLAIRSHAITSWGMGRKFIIDIVPVDEPPMIYVQQGDALRIAFIGQPIQLPDGLSYVSDDKLLTVVVEDANTAPTAKDVPVIAASVTPAIGAGNAAAPPTKENVVLYWRSPGGTKTVQLRTDSTLPHLIARLTRIPDPGAADYDPGEAYIGASYQRVAEMLASLCKDGLINAKFVLQKAPPPILTASELLRNGRPEGTTQVIPGTQPAAQPTGAPATQPGAMDITPPVTIPTELPPPMPGEH